MVIYLIMEGVLCNTPKDKTSILDFQLNKMCIDWILNQPDVSDIVILSNQTWISIQPGIRNGEKFESKIKYCSECLRDILEREGKNIRITYTYSIKYPWTYNFSGESLLDHIWSEKPWLKSQNHICLCRPVPFDTNYLMTKLSNIIKITDLCLN